MVDVSSSCALCRAVINLRPRIKIANVCNCPEAPATAADMLRDFIKNENMNALRCNTLTLLLYILYAVVVK